MKFDELLSRATESVKARMVYAEPIEKDGVTVIPAAQILGGGGGGDADKAGLRGVGGGVGLIARPVGAFVIKDGEVRWKPAVDLNRIVTTIGAVAVTGLFVARRIAQAAAARSGAAAE